VEKLALVSCLSSGAAFALTASAAVVTPRATDEALVNPGMGFVHCQYSNRLWAYGALQEPGDTLDWFPGASVIYLCVNRCQVEPEEGVYRWDILDRNPVGTVTLNR